MCHIHQANLARLGDERFLSLECICRWFCLFKMAGPSREEKYKVEKKNEAFERFCFWASLSTFYGAAIYMQFTQAHVSVLICFESVSKNLIFCWCCTFEVSRVLLWPLYRVGKYSHQSVFVYAHWTVTSTLYIRTSFFVVFSVSSNPYWLVRAQVKRVLSLNLSPMTESVFSSKFWRRVRVKPKIWCMWQIQLL